MLYTHTITKVQKYHARLFRGILIRLFISLIYLSIGLATGYVWGGIILSLLYLSIQSLIALPQSTYLVHRLEISEASITIKYDKKDTVLEVTGLISDFNLVKKLGLRIEFLEIYYRNRLVLKQYESQFWSGKDFTEIVRILRTKD